MSIYLRTNWNRFDFATRGVHPFPPRASPPSARPNASHLPGHRGSGRGRGCPRVPLPPRSVAWAPAPRAAAAGTQTLGNDLSSFPEEKRLWLRQCAIAHGFERGIKGGGREVKGRGGGGRRAYTFTRPTTSSCNVDVAMGTIVFPLGWEEAGKGVGRERTERLKYLL